MNREFDPFGQFPAPISNPEAWPPNYADGFNDAVRLMEDAMTLVRTHFVTIVPAVKLNFPPGVGRERSDALYVAEEDAEIEGKPDGCAGGCPPQTVCDYCQGTLNRRIAEKSEDCGNKNPTTDTPKPL